MPQMSPMMWLFLLLYSISILMIIMIMSYFQWMPNNLKKNIMKPKHKKKNKKW